MFVLSRDVSAAKKVIATLLATAMVLWATGAFNNTAQAANITDVYVLLTDSAPTASSSQTIEFVTPNGVAAGETIVVTYPAGFNLGSLIEDDLDLDQNGVAELTAAAPSGATWGAVIAGQTITFTSGTGVIAANATVTIRVGTNAVDSGTGANEISNPTPTNGNESFEIDISAGTSDAGHTRVVILDTVLMTAIVDTVFDFTVTGLATSTTVNGTTTTGTSGSTTIPYGKLVANTSEFIGQRLNVSTNARNGFVVTVQADGPFDSSTGADIDVFDDGVISSTPAAWTPPANTLGSENTYGHWGVTSDDPTADRGANEFGADEYVGLSTSTVNVFWHDGPSDGVTADIGSTTVGYRVEISPLQEAGDDYNTTLTYIATPTF